MPPPSTLLDCLSAAYRLDLEGEAYVRNVLAAATAVLDRGLGVMAYTYEVRDGAPPIIEHFVTSDRFDPRWLERFYESVAAADLDSRPENPAGFHSWGHLLCEQASAVPGMRPSCLTSRTSAGRETPSRSTRSTPAAGACGSARRSARPGRYPPSG